MGEYGKRKENESVHTSVLTELSKSPVKKLSDFANLFTSLEVSVIIYLNIYSHYRYFWMRRREENVNCIR